MSEYQAKPQEIKSARLPNGHWQWEDAAWRWERNARHMADEKLRTTTAGQAATAEGWGFMYWRFLFDCAYITAQVHAGRQSIADYHQTMNEAELKAAIMAAKQNQPIYASRVWVEKQRKAAEMRKQKLDTGGNLGQFVEATI